MQAELTFLAVGALHCHTQQNRNFFTNKIVSGLEDKTVKKKRHRTTLRKRLEDLNDYLDMAEALQSLMSNS